jgi:hypothetical protein
LCCGVGGGASAPASAAVSQSPLPPLYRPLLRLDENLDLESDDGLEFDLVDLDLDSNNR